MILDFTIECNECAKMTQLEDAPGEPTTTIYSRGDNSSQSRGDGDLPLPPVNDSPSVTGTIAAVTVAVLACVLLLTMIVICRALRKRRRARQGERIDDIPTVSTGIMGTGKLLLFNLFLPKCFNLSAGHRISNFIMETHWKLSNINHGNPII